MTEEEISRAFYEAAAADPEVEVLSWQAVDGKGYFAADVKLRLPDRRRVEPDLILTFDGTLWLIEIKASHGEATSDESKLAETLDLLGDAGISRQVELRSGAPTATAELVMAVAYFDGDTQRAKGSPRGPGCVDRIVHINWKAIQAELSLSTLGGCLIRAYRARQRST